MHRKGLDQQNVMFPRDAVAPVKWAGEVKRTAERREEVGREWDFGGRAGNRK